MARKARSTRPRRPKQKTWTEAEIRALPDEELRGLANNFAQPEEVQQLARMHARAREVKDLAKIEPIDHAVIAQPHTPIYRMHRYYARRPWSVFNELILHYSNPGNIILDPFCGGGVTVVEGVRLGRKVIGVDLSPLATWITRMELATVDLEELDKTFQQLEATVKPEIEALYRTRCPKCGAEASANWIEHSLVHECEKCHASVVVAHATKIAGKSVGAASAGYRCNECDTHFEPCRDRDAERVAVALHYTCARCGASEVKPADASDVEMQREAESRCAERVASSADLPIPDDPFPDGYFQKHYSYYERGFRKMADFFTARNLVANAMLKKALLSSGFESPIRTALLFCFSATLSWTSKMINDTGHGWQRAAYWLPDVSYEQNVWRMFAQRFKGGQSTLWSGLRWASEHLPCRQEAGSLDAITGAATHCILTRSSADLPLPDARVDVIITDPPYGANVQYAELCDFWVVWLKDTGVLDGAAIGKDGLIDAREEAIQTPATGFPMAKSLTHYRDTMHRVFQECRRVLKPGGWVVMTFHNREFKVWNALHAAAHDAGFAMPEHDGLIYQPAIQNYTQTLQLRRAGSMVGDFIVSFKRSATVPKRPMIPEVEIGSKVRRVAEETIAYHGSASLSTIYMRLIPFLVNSGLLDKVQEKDIVQFLTEDFETRVGDEANERWHFKEQPARLASAQPLDFVPVEARIEYVIRSLLRQKRHATQEDVQIAVYSQLINSNAAEYEEIQRVLRRICVMPQVKGQRRGAYILREDAEAQGVLDLFEAGQPAATEQEEGARAESEHDLVIEDLARLAIARSLEIHIGKNEQAKYARFRQWSKPMTYPAEFGIHPQAFDAITQIDTLWLQGQSITSAFEVEKSTTIDSGITRFRELFAALPNVAVPAYIVVPDDRDGEVQRKLGSLANRRDSLTTKVRYILFSDIMGKPSVDLDAVARQVT